MQLDLKHVDQARGSNIVKIGIDLKEFYLSVEWDILDVPATRNEEYYTPQHVRDNEIAMLENGEEIETDEEKREHGSEKLLTGELRTSSTCLPYNISRTK